MSATPEQARAEQLAYGRATLRTSSDHPRVERTPRPRIDAPRAPAAAIRGHDAILKAMQDNRQIATIITANDGAKFTGIVTGRDKFTITLKTKHPDAARAEKGDTILRVFYKSAIEQFFGEQVPRANETAVQ